MKKVLLITMTIVMLLSLSSCAAKQIEAMNEEILTLKGDVEELNSTVDDIYVEIMATPTPIPTAVPTMEISELIPLEDFITAFEDAGLSMKDIRHFDEKSDPNNLLGRPGGYAAKCSFDHRGDSSADDLTIEAYQSEEGAIKRKEYIDWVVESQNMSRLLQYIYVEGPYIFRINHDVLPSEAAQYEEVFREVATR